MSRSKKHPRKKQGGFSSERRATPASKRESASAGERSPTAATKQVSRFRDKHPVLCFLLLFGGLLGLFNVVFLLPPEEFPSVHNAFTAYLSFYARVSGQLLGIFGYDITVTGQSIHSPEFSVVVVRGCDAIEATAIFVAAIIASPVAIRFKIPGILGGTLLLGVTNLVRICSLFYIGIRFPNMFHTIHFEVWQPVFIILAVCLWLVWATWAKRRTTGWKPAIQKVAAHVSS
ncbi:MAG: archaeosortase/exosortase family protein [Phycisphaerae bacterium]|nr:archaeosortase/exosortase family protein [Phycisphaerae bacterium]